MSAAPSSDLPTRAAPLSERARNATRLGVYGGSFDPVHRAHLWVARTAQQAFELDHVVWIPAARPPHKPGVELAPGADRLAMVELAIRAEPAWSAWSFELEHAGPSYTIDTLRELVRLRAHGPAERASPAGSPARSDGLYLIIGGDNLPSFPRWREVDAVVRLAQPVVVARRDAARAALEALHGALPAAELARLAAGFLDVEPLDLSATELRARIRAGADLSDELPAGVAEHVRVHGLYISKG